MKLFKEMLVLEESAQMTGRNASVIDINAQPLRLGDNTVDLNTIRKTSDGYIDEAEFLVSGNGSEFRVEVYFSQPINASEGEWDDFEMVIDGVDEDSEEGVQIFGAIKKLITYYMDKLFFHSIEDAIDYDNAERDERDGLDPRSYRYEL